MSQKQIYVGLGAVVLLAALIAGYFLFGPASAFREVPDDP